MNDPIKHFEQSAQNICLTSEERLHIRERLERHMLLNPLPPIKSPYQKYLRTPFVLTLAVALIMLSGGTAFAAENALPGQALYGVKVSVIEPIEGSLQVGAAAQAKWQIHLANTRLAETEALAEAGALSSSTEMRLAARVADATTKAAVEVAALASTSPDIAISTAHLLDATVAAHARAVAALSLASNASDTPVLAAVLSVSATPSVSTTTTVTAAVMARPVAVYPVPVMRIKPLKGKLIATSTLSASTTPSTATTTSYARAVELFAHVRVIAGDSAAVSSTNSVSGSVNSGTILRVNAP